MFRSWGILDEASCMVLDYNEEGDGGVVVARMVMRIKMMKYDDDYDNEGNGANDDDKDFPSSL